jgi:hypothetical protein
MGGNVYSNTFRSWSTWVVTSHWIYWIFAKPDDRPISFDVATYTLAWSNIEQIFHIVLIASSWMWAESMQPHPSPFTQCCRQSTLLRWSYACAQNYFMRMRGIAGNNNTLDRKFPYFANSMYTGCGHFLFSSVCSRPLFMVHCCPYPRRSIIVVAAVTC